MKKIEMFPEWILGTLTFAHYVDGKGTVTISTDTVSDSHWVNMALNTIGVKHITSTVGDDRVGERQNCKVQWKFKMEDIKAECPYLYNKWKIMNDTNAQNL